MLYNENMENPFPLIGQLPKEEEPRHIKKETTQESFDGDFLYRSIMELEKIAGSPDGAARVKSLHLKAQDGKEVDIAELTGVPMQGSGGIAVYAGRKRNAYDDRGKNISTRELPEKPDRIAVLLHELAHAKQFADEKLHKLTSIYDECLYGVMGEDTNAPTRDLLKKIMDAVPDGGVIAQDPDFQEYLKVLDKMDALEKEVSASYEAKRALNDKLDTLENKPFMKFLVKFTSEYRQAQSEYKTTKEQSRKITEEWMQQISQELPAAGKKFGIKRFRLLPVIFLERAANAQALQWMRTLRKKGINLFEDFKLEKDGHVYVENAQSVLKAGLKIHESYAR